MGHTLVANITTAAVVMIKVETEYVVCQIRSEAEEIVYMVTVF